MHVREGHDNVDLKRQLAGRYTTDGMIRHGTQATLQQY
jgi:hypothetical protein